MTVTYIDVKTEKPRLLYDVVDLIIGKDMIVATTGFNKAYVFHMFSSRRIRKVIPNG